MNDKFKTARLQLGQFFKERRLTMGRTQKEVADFIGVTANTINGVETGRFAWDIDLNNRLCAALEIKPFFAPMEEIKSENSTVPDLVGSKFLFAPDEKNRQLYLLHRGFPACLIQIIQTTPVTFKIVDLYDEVDEAELATHPFLEEAKKIWKEYGSEITGGN